MVCWFESPAKYMYRLRTACCCISYWTATDASDMGSNFSVASVCGTYSPRDLWMQCKYYKTSELYLIVITHTDCWSPPYGEKIDYSLRCSFLRHINMFHGSTWNIPKEMKNKNKSNGWWEGNIPKTMKTLVFERRSYSHDVCWLDIF